MIMKEIFPGITIDENVRFGKPVIVGTRVPVEIIVGHLAAGDSIEHVMQEYKIKREEVLAALQYASKIVSQETVTAR